MVFIIMLHHLEMVYFKIMTKWLYIIIINDNTRKAHADKTQNVIFGRGCVNLWWVNTLKWHSFPSRIMIYFPVYEHERKSFNIYKHNYFRITCISHTQRSKTKQINPIILFWHSYPLEIILQLKSPFTFKGYFLS